MAATAARLASSVPDHRHRSGRKRSHHPLDLNQENFESFTVRKIPSDQPDAEEVRRLRVDLYTETPDLRRTSHHIPMAEITPPRRASSARKPSTTRVSEVTVRDRPEAHSSEHRHRRRRTRAEEDMRETEHAHVHRSQSVLTRLLPPERARSTTTAASHQPREIRPRNEGLTRTHTEKRKSRHGEDVITVRRVGRDEHVHDPESLGDTYYHRHSASRSVANRERASSNPAGPSPRSPTTTRRAEPPTVISSRSRERTEPAPSVTRSAVARPSSFLGSIIGIARAPPPPEKQVECLTCLSTYPASRTARLACTHRMCHACLRRIFTLSLTDPQHMPPKCCTTDHIPLNHVEKLFDTKFKMKWNAKYQEYTTKNRLYCPRKGCGEWIKPKDIHVIDPLVSDKKRRRYGKCSRCRTLVCAACNGRWHISPRCPEASDKATQQFIEIAKKEGWQRCYNCSATVELKEGCNHMTCRCLAEFCMICGVKWKGCDCPWFSYQTMEQDRLNHMNVPVNPRVVVVNGQQIDADHRAVRGYQAELEARREQERLDEQLARRLQTLGLHELPAGVDFYQVHDYHDEPVDARFGVGNTGGYHMNTNYVSFHASRPANLPPAPPPAPPRQPLLRQHSRASRAYNSLPSTRAAERVVPRRSATDYHHEAAVHAPLQSATVGVEMPIGDDTGVRGSVLAGLTRDSSVGEGRVEEWRRWVDSVT